jgi:hypothetical protein
MQSFLGAALFFHSHIPNYSEITAPLYEMTKHGFNWNSSTWTLDYVDRFEQFKKALLASYQLFFPNYDLPWYVRCDASDYAVSAVLYMVENEGTSSEIYRIISFASKTFSSAARKGWDTIKKECYAIMFSIDCFSYYLKGKSFIVETDHRNLQWIEHSQVPIIVRWRLIMQSYNFLIRHIPGKMNKVADWLSRIRDENKLVDDGTITFAPLNNNDNVDELINVSTLPIEDLLDTVHGGRNFHYGSYLTWRRAKKLYPTAHISIQAVRDYVRECPICQKTRDTGIRGLPSRTLHLKPPKYRSVIGFDHLAITPPDKNGNNCVVMIVEHFAHFPQAYPVKDYSSDTLAVVLFKHFCTFGVFDAVICDPGSANTSTAIQQLNTWLGLRAIVSTIGRHESNGCEGSNKQFLRHLRTLVFDERLKDQWSSDTVLPLINFELCSRPTPETGGFTPFQLKYGTEDATYFRLPENFPDNTNVVAIINELDANLRVVREISHRLQQELVRERQSNDEPAQSYVEGDFILWNPRERSGDMLPEKLSSPFLGPYEVIEQVNNDVYCRHVVMNWIRRLHVDRIKPFIGSPPSAYAVAKLDYDQFIILSINYYRGNPHVRTSMEFNVTFENETIDVIYNPDLASSAPFIRFVESLSELFPLRFGSREAIREINKIKRSGLIQLPLNSIGYFYLRVFDGDNSEWYDTVGFPDASKRYSHIVTVISVYRYRQRSCDKLHSALLDLYFDLNHILPMF